MSGPVLSARGLGVAREGRLLASLDALDLAPGEAAALLGRNGSGKSTLLRALALVEAPTAGTVAILGEAAGPGTAERLRRSVTLGLPQPWLFAASALANVERGLAARGVGRAERRRRAAEALAEVGLEAVAGRDARALSSGEAARVSLARALVLRTPILLLDEPFAHLDPEALPPVREALLRRLAGGTAILGAAPSPADLGGLEARAVPVAAPEGF